MKRRLKIGIISVLITVIFQMGDSRSAEAERHIFRSSGRDELREWPYPYLEVFAEQVQKMNEIFEVASERKYGKRNFRSLAVKQSEIAKAKLQTFKSHGSADVRKMNAISLAVKAAQKCGRGTSSLLNSRQR